MSDDEGGRIFFSSTGRSLVDEDEISVLSVGVDIGSSTSHLVFSRIVLERLDSRYVVSKREAFYQSDILLTPYAAEEEIDAEALGKFIESQYQTANVDPDEIDTGALILTGVAVRRQATREGSANCSPARPARWSRSRPATISRPSWRRTAPARRRARSATRRRS